VSRPSVDNLLDQLWAQLRQQGFDRTVVPEPRADRGPSGDTGSSTTTTDNSPPSDSAPDFGQALTREKLEHYHQTTDPTPHQVPVDPGVLVTPAAQDYARDENLELRRT